MIDGAAGVVVQAHGKINLGLEILGRRSDGFHEIRTVMVPIALHDTIEMRPLAGLGVRWPAGTVAPPDDLVRRAAQILRERTSTRLGARITIQKNLPMAAGIGGGSADAAATLFGLNWLWKLGLSRAELQTIGAELGSDVPFFLDGGPALARGRGEVIVPIPERLSSWMLLVTPQWSISGKTARAYAALTPDCFSDGGTVDELAASLKTDVPLSALSLPNTFEQVVGSVFPEWPLLRHQLQEATGRPFWLTGAGPSLYALLDRRSDANHAKRRADSLGHPAIVTRVVSAEPRVAPLSC